MDDGMDEVIKEFLIECNEGLDQLDRDLVELEKDPESAPLLASVFRSVHTIKGTGGVLGFGKLTSVAHVGESLLSRMRDGKLRLNAQITTVLLTVIDALRSMLSSIAATGGDGDGDYSKVIASVNGLLDSGAPGGPGGSAHSPASNPVPKVNETPVASAAVVSPPPPEALPRQAQADPAREILSEHKATEVKAASEGPQVQEEVSQLQNEKRDALAASTIRVDVGLLDKVMNLVGELVLARNQVLQFTTTTQDTGFLGTAQRLNLITTELQEGVMKTRMQPIGNVWNKLPRVVRDLAIGCGKDVQIEMQGSETELDKTIIEAIKDPLMHIVRNAVDHGIETPEARVRAGKAGARKAVAPGVPRGRPGQHRDPRRRRGHQPGRVKQKALERGLVTAEQAARMTEREALNLIFLPGFSTAKKVTNVSGRGVGMDVVKTNIEKIGGSVDISERDGPGHHFEDQDPANPGHHSRADRHQRRRALCHSAGQPAGTGAPGGRAGRATGIEYLTAAGLSPARQPAALGRSQPGTAPRKPCRRPATRGGQHRGPAGGRPPVRPGRGRDQRHRGDRGQTARQATQGHQLALRAPPSWGMATSPSSWTCSVWRRCPTWSPKSGHGR